MDGHDAVLGLANGAEPPVLDPGSLSPFLTSLVSSKMPIEFAPVWSLTTIFWSRPRIMWWSQRCCLRTSRKVRGATPAYKAIGSTLFSGMSDSCSET
jgi:hypothetical protein